MTDNLVKINLDFENVCDVDIPAKYIRNLSITGVAQHSSYDLNTNTDHDNNLYADSATFTEIVRQKAPDFNRGMNG